MKMEDKESFFGESRIRLVEGMNRIFKEIFEGGKSCWISLEAPSGWGKTKVIQEFYSSLVNKYNPEYWPASLVNPNSDSNLLERRKRIAPLFSDFDRKSGAIPKFMWFGIQSEMRSGDPINTLLIDKEQITAHLPYLTIAWGKLVGIKKKLIPENQNVSEALESILSDAGSLVLKDVPGLGTILGLSKWLWNYYEKQTKKDKKLNRSGKIFYVENPISELDEMVDILTKLAIPKLPLVLVVDDFHKAHKESGKYISFMELLLSKLMKSGKPILIISATWPGEFEKFTEIQKIQRREDISKRTFRVIHDKIPPSMLPKGASLAKLKKHELKHIVKNYFKNCTEQTLNRIVHKYDNPLAIELFCSLPKHKQYLNKKNFELSWEEIHQVPLNIFGLYQELWSSLRLEEKNTLILAQMLTAPGSATWNPRLLLSCLEYYNSNRRKNAKIQIVELTNVPHGLIRPDMDGLWIFTDLNFLEIIKRSISEILTTEQKTIYLSGILFNIVDTLDKFNDKIATNLDYQMILLAKRMGDEKLLKNNILLETKRIFKKEKFHMDAASLGIDVIRDYSLGKIDEGPDILDMSALLLNFNPEKQNISDFILIKNVEGGCIVYIDLTGNRNMEKAKSLVALEGHFNLDADAMYEIGAIKV